MAAKTAQSKGVVTQTVISAVVDTAQELRAFCEIIADADDDVLFSDTPITISGRTLSITINRSYTG